MLCMAEFLAILARNEWALCGVAAAWRWRKSGRYGHGEFVCLWSQDLVEGVRVQQYGVGLFLHRSVLPCLHSWHAVSSRILLARFKLARGRFLTVMVVYAPTSQRKKERTQGVFQGGKRGGCVCGSVRLFRDHW